ncbi:MAG: sigma-70 family RNA polymerase sigma factor [Oscillospiraceae bacterium]|nr:sigma-70 family RNA polymerase sigma factor [Oscillospiraceae bacterium]
MHDSEILRLFAARCERAIAETEQKYGRECRRLAVRILGSDEDAEECFSDALMKAWSTIPPQQPDSLAAYLHVITRNLALNRRKENSRLRRGGGTVPAVLDELADCIPAAETVEAAYDERSFLRRLERFLDTLKPDARKIFVRRYWYVNSTREIAEMYRMSESKVRVSLTRTRRKLKTYLEKEDAE